LSKRTGRDAALPPTYIGRWLLYGKEKIQYKLGRERDIESQYRYLACPCWIWRMDRKGAEARAAICTKLLLRAGRPRAGVGMEPLGPHSASRSRQKRGSCSGRSPDLTEPEMCGVKHQRRWISRSSLMRLKYTTYIHTHHTVAVGGVLHPGHVYPVPANGKSDGQPSRQAFASGGVPQRGR